MPGIIVCNGFFKPSISLIWFFFKLKLLPLQCNNIPVFLDVIPLPNASKSELIKEIIIPSLSLTVR